MTVPPERLGRWLDRFAERHGEPAVETGPAEVRLAAPDGAVAVVEVPFPPLAGELAAHALRERRVGVLLVRRGGYAVGVFGGTSLLASKVGSRHVQGRSAAGGWSQQRFARRREGQAREAFAAAADAAAAVLLPARGELDALVVGGDRRALDAVLAEPRLAPLLPLRSPGVLDVPEPRRRTLDDAPRLFRAVHVRVSDPAG